MLNYIFTHILFILIILPIIGAFYVGLFIPHTNLQKLQNTGLMFSWITFFFSLFLWIFFNNIDSKFQFIEIIYWLPAYNINCFYGIDGISLFFILLVTFLTPICLLSTFTNINKNYKEFIILFLLMESCLIIIFSILDLFLFYIFFESILIPMFLIIGIWGSRKRKIRSNYFFFLYTLFGSIIMLLAIIYIFNVKGTTDYQIILYNPFNFEIQKILWLAFFLGFAIKVPMFPFHIWLPEAHVEAPTVGSVILAGILLKLGTYGFIRFLIPLFPLASVYYTPFIYILGLTGIIYTSLTAMRQIDLKKIIAYASVAHMNLVILGLFSFNIYGISGSILQMFSHGIISSGLFLGIGVLYDRHHTRIIKYYGGISYVMPLFTLIFLILILANIAVPGTSSFTGEFLILIGLNQHNFLITILAATGIVLGAVYSLWLFNRVFFGTIKTKYIVNFNDITKRELYLFLPLIFLIFIMGIYPDIFLKTMNFSIINLIEQIKDL